jgi:archaemetzincin
MAASRPGLRIRLIRCSDHRSDATSSTATPELIAPPVVSVFVNRLTALAIVCAAAATAFHEASADRASPRSAGLPSSTSQPKALDPFAFDASLFEKKRKPMDSDWLASFHEPGQTFEQFLAQPPTGLTRQRRVIVLQPVGEFSRDELAFLGKLRDFATAYFQLPVRIQRPVPLPDHGQRTRGFGSRKWTQFHAGTLMEDVLLPRLPDDAVCYLGITMVDLYPEPSWNFVFGQASFDKRVGVYSLVRYTNRFWGQPEDDQSKALFVRRSFKLLAHETGHMFSILHCTANECLMNGSNSLEETDRSTLHLCPVCLRKLQWSVKFDVLKRYRELRSLYAENAMPDLADWMDRRLAGLGHPTTP